MASIARFDRQQSAHTVTALGGGKLMRFGLVPLGLGIALVACSAPTGPSSLSNTEDLIAGLRQEGASVEARGRVSQPFFSVEAALFAVNHPEPRMQVFEYATPEQADVEAAIVEHEGRAFAARPGASNVTVHVCWIGTPHFYRAGRLIILYTGDDLGVLALLQRRLGRPFAGGSPNPPQMVCR